MYFSFNQLVTLKMKLSRKTITCYFTMKQTTCCMLYLTCTPFRSETPLKNNTCTVSINNCLVALFNGSLMNYKRLPGDMFRCVGYKGLIDIVRVFCHTDYTRGL